MQTTFRTRRVGGFVQVANSTVRDRRLSFRARGVLAYVLSLPDGVPTDSVSIAQSCDVEGRDAVRAALRELGAAGYHHQRRAQAADGRWSREIVWCETPGLDPWEDDPSPRTDSQASVEPHASPAPTPEKPASVSQALREEDEETKTLLAGPTDGSTSSAAEPTLSQAMSQAIDHSRRVGRLIDKLARRIAQHEATGSPHRMAETVRDAIRGDGRADELATIAADHPHLTDDEVLDRLQGAVPRPPLFEGWEDDRPDGPTDDGRLAMAAAVNGFRDRLK